MQNTISLMRSTKWIRNINNRDTPHNNKSQGLYRIKNNSTPFLVQHKYSLGSGQCTVQHKMHSTHSLLIHALCGHWYSPPHYTNQPTRFLTLVNSILQRMFQKRLLSSDSWERIQIRKIRTRKRGLVWNVWNLITGSWGEMFLIFVSLVTILSSCKCWLWVRLYSGGF